LPEVSPAVCAIFALSCNEAGHLKTFFMAVKYRLIDRRNLGKDAGEAPRKVYAQAVNNGYVTFDELCEDISELCTLTSADVKAVLDRMNFVLDKNLRAGRIVQFGEIGNFRMAVGSSGAETEEDFSASMIRVPKIVFTPGKRLRKARTNTGFEKDTPREVEKNCDRDHSGN
jgi:predicted histone-like DNA-binding protein